ncbi:hypothetical protein C8J57DRAFT_1312607 [Mycena rebaudengoi]|nr:hypothetical protein C8J57DRAFT_1312607 [Mycena rebaudengoi]
MLRLLRYTPHPRTSLRTLLARCTTMCPSRCGGYLLVPLVAHPLLGAPRSLAPVPRRLPALRRHTPTLVIHHPTRTPSRRAARSWARFYGLDNAVAGATSDLLSFPHPYPASPSECAAPPGIPYVVIDLRAPDSRTKRSPAAESCLEGACLHRASVPPAWRYIRPPTCAITRCSLASSGVERPSVPPCRAWTKRRMCASCPRFARTALFAVPACCGTACPIRRGAHPARLPCPSLPPPPRHAPNTLLRPSPCPRAPPRPSRAALDPLPHTTRFSVHGPRSALSSANPARSRSDDEIHPPSIYVLPSSMYIAWCSAARG